MKPLVLAGIVIAAVGGFILVRGMSYTKDKNVLDIGGLKASVEEKHSIPNWVGIAAVVGGVVLIVAGAGKARS